MDGYMNIYGWLLSAHMFQASSTSCLQDLASLGLVNRTSKDLADLCYLTASSGYGLTPDRCVACHLRSFQSTCMFYWQCDGKAAVMRVSTLKLHPLTCCRSYPVLHVRRRLELLLALIQSSSGHIMVHRAETAWYILLKLHDWLFRPAITAFKMHIRPILPSLCCSLGRVVRSRYECGSFDGSCCETLPETAYLRTRYYMNAIAPQSDASCLAKPGCKSISTCYPSSDADTCARAPDRTTCVAMTGCLVSGVFAYSKKPVHNLHHPCYSRRLRGGLQLRLPAAVGKQRRPWHV